MSLFDAIDHVKQLLLRAPYLATALAPLVLVPAFTYLVTIISYHVSLSRLSSVTGKDKSRTSRTIAPPMLPYSLPFLGSATSFLSTTPGKFWRSVLSILDRYPALSVLTVYMGERKLHVLYSPKAVNALFKAKNVSRNNFNRDIVIKGMCMSPEDAEVIYGPTKRDPQTGLIDESKADIFEHAQAEIYLKYLLPQNAVNILTGKFNDQFQQELTKWCDAQEDEWQTIPLIAFIKEHMFTAASTTLFGSEIYKFIPDFATKYWVFDTGLLARFYGLPRLLFPKEYEGVAELHTEMVRWVEAGDKHHNYDPPLAEVDWDPNMGAVVIRARRKMCAELGCSASAIASLDLGFLFGLMSNSVPATCWLLSHLLAPSNAGLLAKVQEEIDSARVKGGELDMSILMGLPYLNSVFNETLRMYVDVLVTRELKSDMVIDGHFLKAGEVVMAPSYLGHHDAGEWNAQESITGRPTPPEDTWYGERFLSVDEKTGKATLSTKDTAGKYFPWGGGKHICPGRVFAKQEVFVAVAGFLGRFDIEFMEYYTDGQAKKSKSFGRDEKRGFPVIKKQYSGNGIVSIEGEARVKVRRREW